MIKKNYNYVSKFLFSIFLECELLETIETLD